MQLSELNLNRNLFKNEPDLVIDSSSEDVSATVGTTTPKNSNPGNDSGVKEANQVVTGTVITSCVVQSSGGPDRIEINSKVSGTNKWFTPGQLNIESLTAYSGNQAVAIMNKFGISSVYMATDKITFGGGAYISGDVGGDLNFSSKTGAAIMVMFDSTATLVYKFHMIPTTDDTYDIGNTSKGVRNLYMSGRINLGKVNDPGPMTATAGREGDIVYNLFDSTFYGCVFTGSPGNWVPLS